MQSTADHSPRSLSVIFNVVLDPYSQMLLPVSHNSVFWKKGSGFGDGTVFALQSKLQVSV